MTKKQVGRPLRTLPVSSCPKAENQAEMDWGGEARRILKAELQALRWGYRDLSEHLGILGVEMDPPAINRRINRGNFSAAFLLMCLKAMKLRVEVVPEGAAPKRRAEREKPIDALESVIGIWGTKAR